MSGQMKAPEWLKEFQVEFSKSVRVPFDFSSGKSIRKQTELFSKQSYQNINPYRELLPKERLALYNEQYWFRFLTLMQGDYPLLSRYMGLWEFNKLVTEYLTHNPSKSVYLQLLGEGFPEYISNLSLQDSTLNKKYLEMATLDRLWSDVFMSRGAEPWTPTKIELEGLEVRLIEFHPSFKLFEGCWNWVELRKTALSLQGEEVLSQLPIERNEKWVFFRSDTGVVSMPLEGALFRLLELLQTELLHVSLEMLSNEFPEEDLNSKVMHWFQQGLKLGWFTGVKK